MFPPKWLKQALQLTGICATKAIFNSKKTHFWPVCAVGHKREAHKVFFSFNWGKKSSDKYSKHLKIGTAVYRNPCDKNKFFALNSTFLTSVGPRKGASERKRWGWRFNKEIDFLDQVVKGGKQCIRKLEFAQDGEKNLRRRSAGKKFPGATFRKRPKFLIRSLKTETETVGKEPIPIPMPKTVCREADSNALIFCLEANSSKT